MENSIITTAYYLFLKEGKMPELFKGIKLTRTNLGPVILLPKIDGVNPRKFMVQMDKRNPPRIMNERVQNVFFQLHRGTKFADPVTFVTAMEPDQVTDKVVILTSVRWPMLDYQIMPGSKPNGFLPGVQILNESDAIQFSYGEKKWQITNVEGFANLVQVYEKKAAAPPAKKEDKAEEVSNRPAKPKGTGPTIIGTVKNFFSPKKKTVKEKGIQKRVPPKDEVNRTGSDANAILQEGHVPVASDALGDARGGDVLTRLLEDAQKKEGSNKS